MRGGSGVGTLWEWRCAIEIRVSNVVRVAAGEDGAGWRRALETGEWVDGAVVMKSEGGSWVRRATMMGREVVVKCRELGTVWKRVKFGVGMGHGAKQWRGAERLMKAGIATGRPLVMARAVVDGRVCEVMVLEFVEGKTLLEILDEVKRGVGPGVREQHAIARAVAETVVKSAKGGFYNRDHKPSNLIVRRDADGRWDIAVIDCVGLKWRAPVDDSGNEWMFAALMIEAIGCGCGPRRALWARVVMSLGWTNGGRERVRLRDLREEVVEQVELEIKVHGDPRPRVDPLGRGRADRSGT